MSVRDRLAVSMLASLEQALGDLDRVSAWVKAAINGFSDLILELWGDAGRHSRSAIGSGELPFGMPVEVEAVVAIV